MPEPHFFATCLKCNTRAPKEDLLTLCMFASDNEVFCRQCGSPDLQLGWEVQ